MLLACAGQPHKPIPRPSEETQAKRLALIEELQKLGVFGKIEPTEAWVKPVFYSRNFADRTAYASLVFAYFHEGPEQSTSRLELRDNQTGKVVGEYTLRSGLVMH